jgi:hypothetical protein
MDIGDGDLVRLARDGDPAAFRLLVEPAAQKVSGGTPTPSTTCENRSLRKIPFRIQSVDRGLASAGIFTEDTILRARTDRTEAAVPVQANLARCMVTLRSLRHALAAVVVDRFVERATCASGAISVIGGTTPWYPCS